MRAFAVLGAVVVILLLAAVAVVARARAIPPLERLPGGIVAGPAVEDVTDTSAVVTLTTGAPAFCQVNYGETTAYGQMRRMSMTGAMTDHQILLPGLKANMLYHVRLTAVDAQARIYQSRDFTFRTKTAATSGGAQGPNVASLLAGARIVGVSSNFAGGGNASTFGADKAIDGVPTTEWSSNGDGNKAWIEVELAKPTRLAAIGFWTRTMGTSAEIRQFVVVADGKTTLGPFTVPNASGMHFFPVDVTAKRLRFNVLKSSGGNTGAIEIEARAAP